MAAFALMVRCGIFTENRMQALFDISLHFYSVFVMYIGNMIHNNENCTAMIGTMLLYCVLILYLRHPLLKQFRLKQGELSILRLAWNTGTAEATSTSDRLREFVNLVHLDGEIRQDYKLSDTVSFVDYLALGSIIV